MSKNMRVLALVLLVLFFSLSVFAIDRSACLRQSLDKANWDQIFGAASGFSADMMVKLNEAPYILQAAQLQQSLLPMVGIPQSFEPAKASETKDSKGISHELFQISLTNFHAGDWRDPEKRKKIIENFCRPRFGDLAEMCSSARFALGNYIDGFNEEFHTKIQSMADDALRDPRRSWEDIAGNFDFTYQQGKDPTLANQVYLGDEEVGYLMSVGGIVLAQDSRGDFVGYALQVGKPGGGKPELYFIQSSGDSQFLNPYFFVFGDIPAATWNQKFGFGELSPV